MISTLLFCLFHCKEPKVPSDLFCLVDNVKYEEIDNVRCWVAYCSGSNTVIFNRPVELNDRVYYLPYYEDDDAVTTHGYILSIAPPLQ